MSREQLIQLLGTDTLEQRQRLIDAEEACRQLRELTYIMGEHQAWPAEGAMRLNVDVQTRTELGMVDDVMVMYTPQSDQISSPSMLRSSTHSDYKSTNTLKYHAIVLSGVYMPEITQGESGKTSDNQLHSIAKRTALACGNDRKPALICDKGFNSSGSFAEHGVLLLRPYVKEQRQVAASPEE
jgi:hypothetical protein